MRKKSRRRNSNLPVPLLFLIGGGLLLIIAAVIIIALQGNGSGNPSLVEVKGQPAVRVDQELIDYGDVKYNVPVSFQIRVTNVGDKTLRFTKEPYIKVAEGC